MSRAVWTVTLVLAVAFVLAPGFLERFRRVKRAMGAFLIFWIAMNLWGTSLHFTGLRPAGAPRGVLLLGPPLLLAAAWVYWDLRRRRGA
jgi:hypothetical protein